MQDARLAVQMRVYIHEDPESGVPRYARKLLESCAQHRGRMTVFLKVFDFLRLHFLRRKILRNGVWELFLLREDCDCSLRHQDMFSGLFFGSNLYTGDSLRFL